MSLLIGKVGGEQRKGRGDEGPSPRQEMRLLLLANVGRGNQRRMWIKL